MCSRYEAPTPERLRTAWPAATVAQDWARTDIWPGYAAPFLHRAPPGRGGGASPLEILAGNFGLIPAWARDDGVGRRTYNARSETVATRPAFRDAWRQARHCIVPAEAIYEPDWRSGRAVPTRIGRADGDLLGIAGLYEARRGPDGAPAWSFTMLTLNADGHAVFGHLHKPDPALPPDRQDKRMVAILPRGLYAAWLDAPVQQAMDFMKTFPAARLVAVAQPAAAAARGPSAV